MKYSCNASEKIQREMGRIVLGSGSEYRKSLLEEMGFEFDVIVADIDEYSVVVEGFPQERRKWTPAGLLTEAIARAKYEEVWRILGERGEVDEEMVVVVGDQVAVFEGEIREKPESEEECFAWMQEYQEKGVEYCSCIMVGNGKKSIHGVVEGFQKYKTIPSNILMRIIKESGIMSCCGGFMVSSPLIEPFLAESKGTKDEIMGFPKQLVSHLLQEINT